MSSHVQIELVNDAAYEILSSHAGKQGLDSKRERKAARVFFIVSIIDSNGC